MRVKQKKVWGLLVRDCILHFLMGTLGKNVIFGSFGENRFSPIEIPNIEFLTLERDDCAQNHLK